MLLLATILGPFGFVSAQDATPPADAAWGIGGPAIGTVISQTNAEGVEQGLITVTEDSDRNVPDFESLACPGRLNRAPDATSIPAEAGRR